MKSRENRIGFAAQERDEESRYFAMGARQYDCLSGRFLSLDPLMDKFPEMSPYSYANNNQISFKDPSGLEPEGEKGRDEVQVYQAMNDDEWYLYKKQVCDEGSKATNPAIKTNSKDKSFWEKVANEKKIAILFLISIYLLSSGCLLSQKIAAGGRHSLSICSDSTVEAWGYNGYGQLGNGNKTEQHTGQKVIGINNVVQVAGGLFHSIFVKSDGTVWTCGRNPLGNLGDGTNVDKSTPVQVVGLKDIIQAAGGGEHTLFFASDNTVWATGNNSSGQLGDGTNINKNIPVKINGLSGIIQVAAGAEYSLFLKNNGTVWACGHNGYGQYGNGTNKSSNVPVQIANLSEIIQVSAGEWHSLFLKSDGSVYSSGRNQYGQLGDGTIKDKNTAEQILSLSGITQVEAGGIHSVFLKNDGSVWACGLNSGGNNDGQLGDGTKVDRYTPVQVVSSWTNTKITRVEATREHSLFLNEDGSIWAAGRNNYGQLGKGDFTTLNSYLPIHAKSICKAILSDIIEISEFIDNDLSVSQNNNTLILSTKSNNIIKKYELINILGEKVITNSSYRESNYLEININNIPCGIYILKIFIHNKHLVIRKILLDG